MSFWSTDWQLEAVNGHDQTTHANDGLQLPGRANLDPGVMAGNDVIAPVAGNSVLDRAGELSITPHGSWLQHVPTNDRRNATVRAPQTLIEAVTSTNITRGLIVHLYAEWHLELGSLL